MGVCSSGDAKVILSDDQASSVLQLTQFAHVFSNKELKTLVEYVQIRKFAENKVIFKQGKPAAAFYVVIQGDVGLRIREQSAKSSDKRHTDSALQRRRESVIHSFHRCRVRGNSNPTRSPSNMNSDSEIPDVLDVVPSNEHRVQTKDDTIPDYDPIERSSSMLNFAPNERTSKVFADHFLCCKSRGQYLGNDMLMKRQNYIASAYAMTECDCVVLTKTSYNEYIAEYPAMEEKLLACTSCNFVSSLLKIPFLHETKVSSLERLALIFNEIQLEQDQVLFRAGDYPPDVGNSLYFLTQGSLQAALQNELNKTEPSVSRSTKHRDIPTALPTSPSDDSNNPLSPINEKLRESNSRLSVISDRSHETDSKNASADTNRDSLHQADIEIPENHLTIQANKLDNSEETEAETEVGDQLGDLSIVPKPDGSNARTNRGGSVIFSPPHAMPMYQRRASNIPIAMVTVDRQNTVVGLVAEEDHEESSPGFRLRSINSEVSYSVSRSITDSKRRTSTLSNLSNPVVVTLDSGSLFGEAGLFLNLSRTSTIIASEHCFLMEATSGDLRSLLSFEPSLLRKFQDRVASYDLGFEMTLRNQVVMKYFQAFCASEHSTENLDFWRFAREYRSLPNPKERMTLLKYVLDEFILDGSPNQINISGQQRERLATKVANGACNPELLSQLEMEILFLMARGPWKRFTHSSLFRECLEALNLCDVHPTEDPIGQTTKDHDNDCVNDVQNNNAAKPLTPSSRHGLMGVGLGVTDGSKPVSRLPQVSRRTKIDPDLPDFSFSRF